MRAQTSFDASMVLPELYRLAGGLLRGFEIPMQKAAMRSSLRIVATGLVGLIMSACAAVPAEPKGDVTITQDAFPPGVTVDGWDVELVGIDSLTQTVRFTARVHNASALVLEGLNLKFTYRDCKLARKPKDELEEFRNTSGVVQRTPDGHGDLQCEVVGEQSLGFSNPDSPFVPPKEGRNVDALGKVPRARGRLFWSYKPESAIQRSVVDRAR